MLAVEKLHKLANGCPKWNIIGFFDFLISLQAREWFEKRRGGNGCVLTDGEPVLHGNRIEAPGHWYCHGIAMA